MCPKKATIKVAQRYMSERLYSVSVVCPCAREKELRHEWEGQGALKRKPLMDRGEVGGNSPQAKLSALVANCTPRSCSIP